ncbi:MAG: hypothetical protein ABIW83_05960 [Allosphingosinicella sp.]
MTASNIPRSKLSGLKDCLATGDVAGALRIAARFPDLGAERAAILDAHGAITNPRFCRQIGKEPEALIEAGRLALLRRYPDKAPALG